MELESVGNWYPRKGAGTVWIVDEIEQARYVPLMAHAAKAKVMMGNANQTDKLDVKGLTTLLHLGSLPTVWLPPHEIRDERESHIPMGKSILTPAGNCTVSEYRYPAIVNGSRSQAKPRSHRETFMGQLP